MRLLLDTHTFIWWDSDPARLSSRARELLYDQENELLVSVASVWEMQIKLQLGKLQLAMALEDLVAAQQEVNGVEVLPVALGHVFALGSLPPHHKDPFDRLLVAQANAEDAALVSGDPVLAQYPVRLLW